MSAHGHRQHAPENRRGNPPLAAPPIRDENAPFVDETDAHGLDAFDSEVSLEMSDPTRADRTSDLELFPPEEVVSDNAQVVTAPVVVATPTSGVVPQAVVAPDHQAVAMSNEQDPLPAPAERVPVVVATIPRKPAALSRRLALVAGILACLGVPTVGMLLWRSPARVAAPAAVVDDAVVPSAATAASQTPTPTLLATTPPTPSSTIELSEPTTTSVPNTTPEPLTPPVLDTDVRGQIRAPAPAADVPPPALEPPARPAPLTRGINADVTEVTPVLIGAEPTPPPINAAPAELQVSQPLIEKPLSVAPQPSMNSAAAPLPPAPPMLTPAAPVGAPVVTDAGSATAVTLAPAPARDAADIQMVLTRYRSAFSDLDATAVSEVWPTADSRALARAFRGLEAQGIVFDNCDIRVAGTSAAASCGGTVRYVTKVGGKEPRTEQRRWQFTLGKVRDLWVIQTVESR